ncbi:GlxA family transcriptional regulator [Streptomyces cyanogenus]|uniref:HTH-type transcriptional regulator CdhR n=1 Tax=Streptomyces cyanogenus TaxID=80860 RepID=A0ABX7TRF7_STRCY|nr:DJ-1/PfpI family protein [Streptomyces cyanogenus]QTD98133.1 HTH-type transcriptional regulator CdhR [Streptomyces cyanogenus]
MRRVAVVAVPPATTFDLSIPELVLGETTVDGRPGYRVRVCTARPGPIATNSSLEVTVPHGLEAVDDADTVIVAGTGARDDIEPRVLAALRRAAAAGKRVASICTGAFVLAQAGLLDGRSATTYWAKSEEFSSRFPSVELRPDVLYVQDGNLLTSAGLSAGIDLCLHLVRIDYGAATANAVARLVVAAPVRPGGQAQFIETPLPPETGTSLAGTRAWALDRLHEPLTRADLAAHARTSVRTLTRRFHAETGLSPLQWLLHQRVIRAQELLETTGLPMDHVARLSGLATTDSLRRHLTRRTGLTPSAYRAVFTRQPGPGDPGTAAARVPEDEGGFRRSAPHRCPGGQRGSLPECGTQGASGRAQVRASGASPRHSIS